MPHICGAVAALSNSYPKLPSQVPPSLTLEQWTALVRIQKVDVSKVTTTWWPSSPPLVLQFQLRMRVISINNVKHVRYMFYVIGAYDFSYYYS